MPQKVGPIRRPDQTSIPHGKNPKQSGVVVVDSCFATIVAYQEGVTNREDLLKNKPLALI